MAGKKLRTLLMCTLSIMLCMATAVVGTYALFTDKVTLNNHLQAGTLEISLVRTKLTKTELTADGYLKTSELPDEGNGKDFSSTNTTNENVFGITDGTLVVPGSSYQADLKLTNGGSVAFTYTVAIVFDGVDSDALKDQALAEQLKITAGKSEATAVTKMLSKIKLDEQDGTFTIFTDELAATDPSVNFFVKVEFVNNTDNTTNNAAKNGKVKFDIVVSAFQKTTAPSSGN